MMQDTQMKESVQVGNQQILQCLQSFAEALEVSRVVDRGRVSKTVFESAFEGHDEGVVHAVMTLLEDEECLYRSGESEKGFAGIVWTVNIGVLTELLNRSEFDIVEHVHVEEDQTSQPTVEDMRKEAQKLIERGQALSKRAERIELLEAKISDVTERILHKETELGQLKTSLGEYESEYRQLSGSSFSDVAPVQISVTDVFSENESEGGDVEAVESSQDVFVIENRSLNLFIALNSTFVDQSVISDDVARQCGYGSALGAMGSLRSSYRLGSFGRLVGMSRTKKSGNRYYTYSIPNRVLSLLKSGKITSVSRSGLSPTITKTGLKTAMNTLHGVFNRRLNSSVTRADCDQFFEKAGCNNADHLWKRLQRYSGCYYAGRRLILSDAEEPTFMLA